MRKPPLYGLSLILFLFNQLVDGRAPHFYADALLIVAMVIGLVALVRELGAWYRMQ